MNTEIPNAARPEVDQEAIARRSGPRARRAAFPRVLPLLTWLPCAAAVCALALVAGCGSSGKAMAGAKCSSTSSCTPGLVCVQDQCTTPCTRHEDCDEANGFSCASAQTDADGGGTVLACVPGAVPRTAGGYGTSCGLHLDADCDTASGFTCPWSQNDADAYCTKLDGCATDADCPSRMYCGILRRAACVGTTACATDADCDHLLPGSKCTDFGTGTMGCVLDRDCHRSPNDCPVGATCSSVPGTGTKFDLARACVERNACAPCTDDRDCASPAEACIPDENGEGFCSRPCELGGTSCDTGAACQTTPKGDYCVPRAGTCHGDATSCAPCRDDGDCGATGYCVNDPSTRERYCIEPCAGLGGATAPTCPNAPGGGPMVCCTNKTNCGSALNLCIPVPHGNPYPRSSTGCWLRPCQMNGDCATGEVCDVISESLVSNSELNTTCGDFGVCRPVRDPTYALDYQLFSRVCDCAGSQYLSEKELAANPNGAFRGCCMTFKTSDGATYSCGDPAPVASPGQ